MQAFEFNANSKLDDTSLSRGHYGRDSQIEFWIVWWSFTFLRLILNTFDSGKLTEFWFMFTWGFVFACFTLHLLMLHPAVFTNKDL